MKTKDLLTAAGYVDLKAVSHTPKWELWHGCFAGPTRVLNESFVVLSRTCAWSDMPDIAAAIRSLRPRPVVLVTPSAERLASNRGRIAQELQLETVLLPDEFLRNVIGTALRTPDRQAIIEDHGLHYFVEPEIHFPSDPHERLACAPLLSWLTKDTTPAEDHRIAVVLAPAGMGKTTLAAYLYLKLVSAPRRDRIPLLVTPKQWLNLSAREELSLDDVWRLAISSCYPEALLGRHQVDACIASGAISVIFDGLDEICALVPNAFNIEETIHQLSALVEDGRLLITSRRRFWDENTQPAVQAKVLQIQLRPFATKQIGSYIAARFPQEPQKAARAEAILELLRRRTTSVPPPGGATGVPESPLQAPAHARIDNIPFIVMLATESADTATVDIPKDYGHLFSARDPLEGLLLSVCIRERERQGLGINPQLQLAILESLAAECHTFFSLEEVEIAFSVLAGTHDRKVVARFLQHELLVERDGGFSFKSSFVYEYLLARLVAAWYGDSRRFTGVDSSLQVCAQPTSSLVDRCALLIEELHPRWRELAKPRWQDSRLNQFARAGFLRILIRLCRAGEQGPKRDAVDLLLEIVGDSRIRRFERITWSGPCHSLDLRGVVFAECTFDNIEWVQCDFNDSTAFVRCNFRASLRQTNCSGFRDIQYLDCSFSSAARAAIQRDVGARTTIATEKDEITSAVAETLRRFSNGQLGFRPRPKEGIRRSVRATTAFGDTLLEELEKGGVLEVFVSGGQDLYKVRSAHDVRVFLQDGIPIGSLVKTIERLEEIFLRT